MLKLLESKYLIFTEKIRNKPKNEERRWHFTEKCTFSFDALFSKHPAMINCQTISTTDTHCYCRLSWPPVDGAEGYQVKLYQGTNENKHEYLDQEANVQYPQQEFNLQKHLPNGKKYFLEVSKITGNETAYIVIEDIVKFS